VNSTRLASDPAIGWGEEVIVWENLGTALYAILQLGVKAGGIECAEDEKQECHFWIAFAFDAVQRFAQQPKQIRIRSIFRCDSIRDFRNQGGIRDLKQRTSHISSGVGSFSLADHPKIGITLCQHQLGSREWFKVAYFSGADFPRALGQRPDFPFGLGVNHEKAVRFPAVRAP
jgi:hypothetical protein